MKASEKKALLSTLQARFEAHPARHPGLPWARVLERLDGNGAALKSLGAMEETGGEPDVIGSDAATRELLYCDCSSESPSGRRSLCYDEEGRASRKEARPASSALAMARAMGITLLDEDQYRALQQLGEFDLKTSSWLVTPAAMRSSGGALFGDRRYGRVFAYHNGAQSYYAARGFRGLLRV
ncbi:MAG TPA: DUF4256 domain-containing protein [Polyangiaceae bacterium]|nr:DUF4256 domain-containing protein [Polyangiaceae bacterium]